MRGLPVKGAQASRLPTYLFKITWNESQVPENQDSKVNPDASLASEVKNFLLSQPEIGSIEISTVRGTRLRFPEANQAAPFFCPDHAIHKPFEKPPKSAEQLVSQLERRGLQIKDRALAIHWIQKVGYYRLSGYGLQFRSWDGAGKLTDDFLPGTRFEQLSELYEFDRHLRLLALDGIERIEVAFRSRLNDTMAERHGPHWFMNPALFIERRDDRTGALVFNHEEFIDNAYKEARRNKESLSIQHYFRTYGDPALPPCWMLGEVLTMGTWSKVFGMLADRGDQKPVADFFRASPPELTSWIHALTNLRNTCAHHSRLWDRRFVTCPSKKGNLKGVIDANDRLYAQLATALYCLWSIEPESKWLEHLSQLLMDYATVPLGPMGFPPDWQDRLRRMKRQ
jgi:abortive infection bacteriophage resistance protein